MPTTFPASRPEAIPPAAAIRRALGRYICARWHDLWGPPLSLRGDWNRLTGWLNATATIGLPSHSTSPSPAWAVAVARGPWVTARLRWRYEADAASVRALFVGAIVSVLTAAYHVGCNDLSSTIASLGIAFFLAGLALVPAYRCWCLRTRTVGQAHAFLRYPTVWWPDPLPLDNPP